MGKSKIEFETETTAGNFTAVYVADTESMLGRKFSAGFLAFLKAQNGGVPKKQHFKLGKATKVVERFLCLCPDYEERPEFGQFDIGVVWSQIEDRLNDFLVPFAAVFAGDFLCFDYEGGGKPSVVLWNHDLSSEDTPSTELVAENFDAFTAMLAE